MSKALLIGNGENNIPLLKRLSAEADFILAADGGAQAALEAGLKIDAVIGDLDSLSSSARGALAGAELIHVARQDNTDFEKAMDWLIQQGFKQITAVGFTGGRLDFTLGNFLSVYPYLDKADVRFAGEGWTVYPLVHGRTIAARPGARLSLLPLLPCTDITLTGVKYPLANASWQPGQNTGLFLSNQATADHIEIAFASGFLLLYIE